MPSGSTFDSAGCIFEDKPNGSWVPPCSEAMWSWGPWHSLLVPYSFKSSYEARKSTVAEQLHCICWESVKLANYDRILGTPWSPPNTIRSDFLRIAYHGPQSQKKKDNGVGLERRTDSTATVLKALKACWPKFDAQHHQEQSLVTEPWVGLLSTAKCDHPPKKRGKSSIIVIRFFSLNTVYSYSLTFYFI